MDGKAKNLTGTDSSDGSKKDSTDHSYCSPQLVQPFSVTREKYLKEKEAIEVDEVKLNDRKVAWWAEARALKAEEQKLKERRAAFEAEAAAVGEAAKSIIQRKEQLQKDNKRLSAEVKREIEVLKKFRKTLETDDDADKRSSKGTPKKAPPVNSSSKGDVHDYDTDST